MKRLLLLAILLAVAPASADGLCALGPLSPATAAAAATYALVSNTGGSLGINGGTTAAINTTGADLIVLVLAYDIGGVVIAGDITDSKGNTYTQAVARGGSGGAGGNFSSSAIWYKQAPVVGAAHTVTISHVNCFCAAMVLAFSGSTATPLDQTNSALGEPQNTTISTGAVTPLQGNELVIAGIGEDTTAGATFTINSGFTITNQVGLVAGTSYGDAAAYLIQAIAATTNPTWTISASSFSTATIATFKAGTVTAPCTPTLNTLGLGHCC